MPAGLIPNEALAVQLREMLGVVAPNPLPWQLVLFVNNYTPDADATFTDLVEASWNGYVRATLDKSLWSVPVVDDGCAHVDWGTDPIEWAVNAGPIETIYGYAFVEIGSNLIRFIQRLDPADIAPIVVGFTVQLTPKFSLTSAECE